MLGFALVGCGRISKKHADLLAKNIDNANLVAVCDNQPDRARDVGERYSVPWFTDMDQMLTELEDQIDVVSILTPSGLHAEHAIKLAPYGKHLVIEKPMALTVQDADKMIMACDQAGIKMFVVKQNRYNAPIVKLREALVAGRFGKLVMGTVRVRWCRGQEYYDQDAWRGTWALDGGVFANQASHHIDLLMWCLGTPVKVYATSRTALVNIEADDTAAAIIHFSSGALGIVEATTATRPRDLEGSLSILGESGVVEVGGFAVNEMKVWNLEDEIDTNAQVLETYRESPPSVYGFGHKAYLDNVVESIENNTPSLVDGLEGRKSLELISALYESIHTGKEVNLRYVQKDSPLGVQ